METSKAYKLLEGRVSFARHEDGLQIYYVIPQEKREDAGTGAVMVRIGRPNDRPTRCVLLLGETGAGKTTLINAVLNYLFGVEFADSFRLQLNEEIEDERPITQSQTDAITVYTIHHTEGMRHDYNFVLIDTPGLADTGGAPRQERVKAHLKKFLISEDIGAEELHCVGLVAKGTENRVVTHQMDVLGDITALLGDTVQTIMCLLATYATYKKTSVEEVVKSAGVSFTTMFPFDNGILYTRSSLEAEQDASGPTTWKKVCGQYDAFFSHLVKATPVSNRVRREKQLFHTCKNNLKEGFKSLGTLIAALDGYKNRRNQYESQKVENEKWCEEKEGESVISKDLEGCGKDVYAHNCRKCGETCHLCKGSVTGEVAGGMAEVAEVAIKAGAAGAAGAAGVAGAAEAAGAAGAAAQIVAVASPLAITALVGVAAGYLLNKVLDKTYKCDMSESKACTRKGCRHPLDDHVREKKRIFKKSVKEKVDFNKKQLYDEAVSGMEEINIKINEGKKNIRSNRNLISQNTVELVHHAKQVEAFTSQRVDYIESVTEEITQAIGQAGPDGRTKALQHVGALQETMQQWATYGAQEVLGQQHCLEMLLRCVYNEDR